MRQCTVAGAVAVYSCECAHAGARAYVVTAALQLCTKLQSAVRTLMQLSGHSIADKTLLYS